MPSPTRGEGANTGIGLAATESENSYRFFFSYPIRRISF
jgi:hypothetical protein